MDGVCGSWVDEDLGFFVDSVSEVSDVLKYLIGYGVCFKFVS